MQKLADEAQACADAGDLDCSFDGFTSIYIEAFRADPEAACEGHEGPFGCGMTLGLLANDGLRIAQTASPERKLDIAERLLTLSDEMKPTDRPFADIDFQSHLLGMEACLALKDHACAQDHAKHAVKLEDGYRPRFEDVAAEIVLPFRDPTNETDKDFEARVTAFKTRIATAREIAREVQQ